MVPLFVSVPPPPNVHVPDALMVPPLVKPEPSWLIVQLPLVAFIVPLFVIDPVVPIDVLGLFPKLIVQPLPTANEALPDPPLLTRTVPGKLPVQVIVLSSAELVPSSVVVTFAAEKVPPLKPKFLST